jgi:glycosyltransferase involved in cell wall biosynthesis
MLVFSVVVPAYNAASTLRETLDAVLAQSVPDWELVVVDDGSTDSTLAIAREYESRDRRVVVLTQENRGSAGAYNTGVAAASGDFVTICSADDLLLPNHLSSMDSLIAASPGYGIYSSNGYYLNEDGSRTLVYDTDEWACERSLDLAAVIDICFFSVGATYRRELFDLNGGYRTDIYGEDYDFWLRSMARGATHRYTPAPLAVHRLTSSQKSAAVVRLYESNVRVLTDLIESELLTDEEARHARDSISTLKGRIRQGGSTFEEQAELESVRQAEAFRALVTRITGPKHADKAISVAHKLTWIVRPLRLAANRVGAAIRGYLPKR